VQNKQHWRLGLAATCSFVYIPLLVYDDLMSVDPGSLADFVTLRGLIWLLVPFALFELIRRALGENLSLLLIAFAGVSFAAFASHYRIDFIAVSAALGATALVCKRELEKLWLLPFLFALIGTTSIAIRVVIPESQMQKQFHDFAARESRPSLPPLNLQRSIYIVLFDELSAQWLANTSAVPNFERLERTGLSFPLAIANEDFTIGAAYALLNGREPLPWDGPWGRRRHLHLAYRNIFDAASPLTVVGSALPYCAALGAKNIAATCLDEETQVVNYPLARRLRNELYRMSYVFLMHFPLRLLSFWGPAAALYDEGPRDFTELGPTFELERLRVFLRKIGERKPGFYLYHSSLPHWPYYMTKGLNEKVRYWQRSFMGPHTTETLAQVSENYRENIRAADTELGMILDAVEANDPGAVVIVTADHGVASDLNTDRLRPLGSLSQETIHIPLYFYLPKNLLPNGACSPIAQTSDILPTIYELFNVRAEPGVFDGKPLCKEERNSVNVRSGQRTFSLSVEELRRLFD
jgi:hypothetical protein